MPSVTSIRERSSTTLSVVLGLLLLLPASPHAASNLVLCLDGSGEVTIEQNHKGECTDPGVDSKTNEGEGDFLTPSSEEHCTDCADLPLQLTEARDPCGTAIVSSWSLDIDQPAERPLLGASISAEPDDISSPPLSGAPSAPSTSQHASLGSTVLLI